VSALKRSALRRHVARNPAAFGRLQIVNRLGDAGIAVVTAIVLLHVLDVKMSVAVQSFLALGGIGALTIGLASHGVLTQLINGLLLISSDRLYEGDVVEFNNGLSGTIERMGWMETVVRGSDEKMIAVPNTEFMKLQVSNLSRVRYSQVKQQLRFKHKDATKLPLLMRSIKEEIRLACPNVIVDGTRPFRAHWTSIEDDHLEVTVDAHFEVKPVGNAYWDNRQRVLQAINRAVKINQVELHIKQPLGMSALL
jgi:small-conductance mechanosensitive channel